MLGAVVVGIGTAGRVRIRDMLAVLPGSPAEKMVLRGFVSRRSLGEEQGLDQISLEEALTRDDVNVAFICTENTTHEGLIRKFLQAGKHVSVEYPMTLNHAAALELWTSAGDRGLVLHEEHIELFSEDFKALKNEVEGKVFQRGTLHFTGGALKPSAGFPAFSGLARLTWLVELFGQLEVTAAAFEENVDQNYCKMTATFQTSNNRPLTWIEERGPRLPRAKNIDFHFEGCTLSQIPPSPRGSVGLFMQDLNFFSAKLSGLVSAEDLHREKVRILLTLQLADRIQQVCQTAFPAT